MAGQYDIKIVTGTDLSLALTWLDTSGNPVNLTGWSAHMKVRSWPAAALYADISTGTGGITLGGAAGTITLSIPASVTVTLPAGAAKYDLFLTNPAAATSCLLYGNVIVQHGVTT